ncbi:hypothetical protein F5148DRAFT_1276456 [Russula earlei]|uniref:Uncharacterized protein n=1 Tax=Russula earlei TaxID=71964 RepID=A0ACC0U6C7_9AGAM|nr:hypothetical protein F5148DRAFT_1276456 [Russula earlei]
MFATLSSFLPLALQQGSPNPNNGATTKDPPSVKVVEDVKQREVISADEGAIKRKERKTNHESFIVVRPPPAKSNHPLNLQVQLVPPQSRDRDRARSIDTSASQDPEETFLSRFNSNRSEVSSFSGYSSVASFSSVASTSTSSSRRMIIPLYNLQAHNVLTNVIVDAGTDAKVAKFQKRGLEILGLAILEPVEVFGSNPASAFFFLPPTSSNRTSFDEHHDLAQQYTPRPGGADGAHTPASSAFSLSSGGADPASPSVPTIMRPDINTTPTSAPKKIFGKFFKKKDSQPSPPSPLPSPSGGSHFREPRQSVGQSLVVPSQGNPKRNSWLGVPTSGQHSEPPLSPISTITTTSHLQPPVLGIHPSCSSPKHPPQGRPHSYTWVVRKWIKGSNDGLLGNVIGHMNHFNLSDERRQARTPPEEGAVEVHFVWSRGKKKRKLREGAQPVGGSRQAGMPTPSGKTGPGGSLNRSGTIDGAEKRLSSASGRSISTGSDVGSGAGAAHGDDDGGESDPEDSETPWTCTLVLSRFGDGSGGDGGEQLVRVRVATFSPTPHHPKVVALLKVPFPLPDIIVDQLQGIARPSWSGDEEPDGLVLTAEEIKDVVSSTGLWLVVRESIGGVGKISRKGDGWRIRA